MRSERLAFETKQAAAAARYQHPAPAAQRSSGKKNRVVPLPAPTVLSQQAQDEPVGDEQLIELVRHVFDDAQLAVRQSLQSGPFQRFRSGPAFHQFMGQMHAKEQARATAEAKARFSHRGGGGPGGSAPAAALAFAEQNPVVEPPSILASSAEASAVAAAGAAVIPALDLDQLASPSTVDSGQQGSGPGSGRSVSSDLGSGSSGSDEASLLFSSSAPPALGPAPRSRGVGGAGGAGRRGRSRGRSRSPRRHRSTSGDRSAQPASGSLLRLPSAQTAAAVAAAAAMSLIGTATPHASPRDDAPEPSRYALSQGGEIASRSSSVHDETASLLPDGYVEVGFS
jgi:hypothetical protein